jgi:predicted GNAT superfamily acetyltransferase
MIPVDSLLYKIDQKLNKLSTNEHQQINLEDKILALNEAQIKLIKQKVDGWSTVSGLGMDAFKKRYEDLQSLVITYNNQPLTLTLKNAELNQWFANLHALVPKYMFYIDSYVIADKGRCTGRKIWINRDLAKHGDLQFCLNNVHYKPSFEYQETFNFLSSDEISIFTDGTFTPKTINISYMRYPEYINKTGYVMLDGLPSFDQDCELELYLEDELLDLTVQNLAMYTENQSAVQSSIYRIQTNE